MRRCALNSDRLHGLGGPEGTEAVISGFGSQTAPFGETLGLQLTLSAEAWSLTVLEHIFSGHDCRRFLKGWSLRFGLPISTANPWHLDRPLLPKYGWHHDTHLLRYLQWLPSTCSIKSKLLHWHPPPTSLF